MTTASFDVGQGASDTPDDPSVRVPLVHGARDFQSVTDRVVGVVQASTTAGWKILLLGTISLLLVLGGSLTKLVTKGIGVWGENTTIDWAWDITGFVFWIGMPARSSAPSSSSSDRSGGRASTAQRRR